MEGGRLSLSQGGGVGRTGGGTPNPITMVALPLLARLLAVAIVTAAASAQLTADQSPGRARGCIRESER